MNIKYPHSKRSRMYKLTPSRKGLGKSLARRKPVAIARKCWNHKVIRKHILTAVCRQIRKELAKMCSDSFVSCLRKSTFDSFEFISLINEMEVHASTLLTILKGCFMKKSMVQPSAIPCIGICAAIILKYRRPSMSLVQKLISIILYSGHSSKKVMIIIYIYTTIILP